MNLKSFAVATLATAAFATALFAPPRSIGQGVVDDPALTTLMNDVTAQQVIVAENQAQIAAKVAAISETLRLARIFVGRGGGKVP